MISSKNYSRIIILTKKKDNIEIPEDFLTFDTKTATKAKAHSRNLKDDFEVLNFLQNENLRIRKILDIFERKIPYRLEYSQMVHLYDDIRHKKSKVKSQIIEIMIEDDSSFIKQFSRTFNTAFSKYHAQQKD